MANTTLTDKLMRSLPWLMRYPIWRLRELLRRMTDRVDFQELMVIVANHFEPGWDESFKVLDWKTQMARVDDWCNKARKIGQVIRDSDGRPFYHTYFYPAEQYNHSLIEKLAELQRDGFGEVEIHLHHGVKRPDNATNLRQVLDDFRYLLAEEHQLLSRKCGVGSPMYSFVHGNLALANSDGGRFCGVDSEMQILVDTGCYADFTLPSAPNQSQVPRINTIYQCGRELYDSLPHRSGPDLEVGVKPSLPVLFTGPLVFDWRRKVHGIPIPRIDDGALAGNYPLSLARLNRWRNANISIKGRPEWVFIKLYCHGFFPQDQSETIGESILRFWDVVLDFAEKSQKFNVHFVTAREAFNIAMAAIDDNQGNPGLFRDYQMKMIMNSSTDSFEGKGMVHGKDFSESKLDGERKDFVKGPNKIPIRRVEPSR